MRKQRSAGVKSVPKRVFVLAPRLLQLHVFLVLFQHWLLSEQFLGRRQTSTTLLSLLLYLLPVGARSARKSEGVEETRILLVSHPPPKLLRVQASPTRRLHLCHNNH